MTDVYTWGAFYNDGTGLDENDAEQGFASVDLAKVKFLMLFSMTEGRTLHSAFIPEGATPVFFRRRRIELNPNNNSEENRSTVHCIGWNNDKSAVYLFVFGDGSTLLTTDLQAV